MDDRVVFLTGAAEGLGREVARELAKAGRDADFATGQRFNAFQMPEAMRSVVA